jgi:hypothetical protein
VTEPHWLAAVHMLTIHSDQIQAHGGSLGLRDRGLSDSALERPRNRLRYEDDVDLASLAAAYGFVDVSRLATCRSESAALAAHSSQASQLRTCLIRA